VGFGFSLRFCIVSNNPLFSYSLLPLCYVVSFALSAARAVMKTFRSCSDSGLLR